MSGLSLATCTSNLKSVALTVLELLLTGPLRTDAHRHTWNEDSISAIHFVHLGEIVIKLQLHTFCGTRICPIATSYLSRLTLIS